MSTGWTILDSPGDTAGFHARSPEPVRSVTFHTVDRPTLALGSAQTPSAVDERVAAAFGIDVVPRRSGGGAVLMVPGEYLWMDVVVPAGDPLWLDDVGAAMHFVGRWWSAALASLGVASRVHTDPMLRTEWSNQVCFDGVGAGEVMQGSGKLVGISQRRTRQSARFQTMCHLRWRPELVAALVAAPRPSASALAPAVRCVPASAERIRAALVDHRP